MSTEENKATGRRLLDEIANKGNLNAIDKYFAPNYVEHSAPAGVPQTREGVKMLLGGLRAAFPDLHYHIEDEIAEGDTLVHRLTGHGTMKGELQGMPATGKHAMWSEIHIVRFAGGKVVEHWANVDQLGMLQQLGLAPLPGQPGG